jgi:hypothetical protein
MFLLTMLFVFTKFTMYLYTAIDPYVAASL